MITIKRNENGKFLKGHWLILDINAIKDLYYNQKLSTRKIAKLKKCSPAFIGNLLKEYNFILRKNKSGCLSNKSEIIKDLYLNQKKSCAKIGKILKVSGVAIRINLKKMGIPIRNSGVYLIGTKRVFSEEHKSRMNKWRIGIPRTKETKEKISITRKLRGLSLKENNPFYGKHHTHESIEKIRLSKKGKKIKSKLSLFKEKKINQIIDLYLNKSYSSEKIGKIFNLSQPTILRLLRQNKINTSSKGKTKSKWHINRIIKSRRNNGWFKNINNTKKKMSISHSGNKCHFYKGGISLRGYDWCKFNKSLKNSIRNRDNQICMNCGIHREKLKRALNIHHINYDKSLNCYENLISLCNKCHSLTNFNREYWINLFQEKLSKMYNYKYSEDNKIILELKTIS